MASLQFDEASGRYRIRFYFGGQEFKRSIKTKDEKIARGIQARVEETIRLLEHGRLEIPANADPATFILSDGKLGQKPVAERVLTVAEVFASYRAKYPAGAKEASTTYTERIHCNHLHRLLGGKTIAQTLTTANVQDYIDRRSQEEWRGKPIKAQTVKKEVETLRVIWNWAVEMGLLTGLAPIKGAKHGKSKERRPFQTREEIERTISRGGLTPEEEAELWECLFLTRSQIGEVLTHVNTQPAHPYVYPMFVFVAHTGARRSEMLRSRVEDFNLQDRTVLIREKKRDRSKTVTFRRVDLTPLLAAVMADWFARHPGGQYTFCIDRNKPLTRQTAAKTLRRVLGGSRWKRVRGFHVFRHSFASNLAAAGIDQRIIDEWMGHQTEAMRKRYRHLLPDQRRKAIEAVFGS
jgi:integrase